MLQKLIANVGSKELKRSFDPVGPLIIREQVEEEDNERQDVGEMCDVNIQMHIIKTTFK